jgi:hypothetical protein
MKKVNFTLAMLISISGISAIVNAQADPDTAQAVSIDRFSMEAGHLMIRDETNGLPGPNEPIDFDVEPFITKGLGPSGELIAYYNFDVQPTEPAPIFVLFREGEESPVEGQLNIIDDIPGDSDYNDFWEVQKVTVPMNYVANTVTSYTQIMDAGYPIEETIILVNCPVVPEGSSARLRLGDESPELTRGWYRGMIVHYFNFTEKALMVNESDMVPTSPIYVTFNINPDMEGGGPGSGFVTDPATARTHNVTATLPDDESYSPLWWVSVYDNADFDHVSDLASASTANILASGVANVNCPVVLVEDATAVFDEIKAPNSIRLEQNFPNPFRYSTEIRFSTDQVRHISVRIYNVLGKQVAELVNENLQPGDYSVQWNPRDEAGGIYFYSIKAGENQINKRMTLLK